MWLTIANGVLLNFKTNTRIAPSSKVPQPFKVHKNNNIDLKLRENIGYFKKIPRLKYNLKMLFKVKNSIKSRGYATTNNFSWPLY